MSLDSRIWWLIAGIMVIGFVAGAMGYKTYDLQKEIDEINAENAELLQGVKDYEALKDKYDSLTIEYVHQQMALDQAISGAQGQSDVVRDIINRQREIMDTVVINDSIRNEYLRHLRERSGN